MRGRLSHIVVTLLLILYPILVSAASLPDGMGTGDGTSYYEGYDNNTSSDPMMQRVITGVAPIVNGSGGWTLNDQTPTEPYQYWTNSGYTFLNNDTLVFTDGDSISLFTSIGYPAYLEYLMIYDNGNDNPLGAYEYFLSEVPLDDATVPLLLLLTIYGSYKLKRKRKDT